MCDIAIHDLCKTHGNAAAVAALLSAPGGEALARARGKYDRLPLHYACQTGDVELAGLLMSAPGSESYLNSPNAHGFTPIYVAAQNGHVELIRALAMTGHCDLNQSDAGGLTPLHIAARNNHAGAVQALLDAGADSTIRDSIQRTPLNWASEPEVVRILFREGVKQ